MPTLSSESQIDDLRQMIKTYCDRTGESVTDIAKRAGMRREMLYRIINDSYASSPTFENVCKLCAAMGFSVRFETLGK